MINRKIIFITVLSSLIFIIGCKQNKSSNNSISKSKNFTDVESYGLKGKVKSYEIKSYDVENYKFGEPQFELRSTDITNYNNFGFITENEEEYESKYYKSYFRDSYKYSNPKLGIILTRKYETTIDKNQKYFSQSFVYDTILNKIIEIKTINEKDNTSDSYIYSYNENQVRISKYNNITNKLVNLTIEKLDNKGNLISKIEYDEEGIEKDENHIIKLKNGFKKDSSVYRFSDKKIYRIEVFINDDLGRVIKSKSYKNESDLDKIEGYIIEYDNSDTNSSFTKKEFKRNENLIFKNIRVNKKYDDKGNVIEIQKLNLDKNKLEEKSEHKFIYYD
jgi:hypothetical protein